MENINFSFIIPVFNRPSEVDDLLLSLTKQLGETAFEVVIVEDGSTLDCKLICEKYSEQLDISYFFKANSGPGSSRNFGMQKAKGNYYIILDSDCILPPEYMSAVSNFLNKNFVDCFGGPDAARADFSDIQKAINFTMTSFLTTGGIRGGSEAIGKFQPRSFNMGLSKKAFEATKGFGTIHPGEDPDLTLRLWKQGFETKLIPSAFVYHKRRIDWNKFYNQVYKFGKARPILNLWHPNYTKPTFWLPTLFLAGFGAAILFALFSNYLLLQLYVAYFLITFISALMVTKNSKIAFYAIITTAIQFYAYGFGFAKSYYKLFIKKQKPEQAMSEMFF